MDEMQLKWFQNEDGFPFCIHYGYHEGDFGMHTHVDFAELVFVRRGTAVHRVEDVEYLLHKGDIFVINENVAHGYRDAKDFQVVNVMFRYETFLTPDLDIRRTAGYHALFTLEPMLARKPGFISRQKFTTEEFSSLEPRLAYMIDEFGRREPGYQTLLSGAFMELIVYLSRKYESSGTLRFYKEMDVAKPLAYMEGHYTEPISVVMLAEQAGMSVRHFTRVFTAAHGTSPFAYMTNLRLARAKSLLADGDMSVTDVAFSCGYSDSNYFSRLFRTHCGMSPKDYRRTHPRMVKPDFSIASDKS